MNCRDGHHTRVAEASAKPRAERETSTMRWTDFMQAKGKWFKKKPFTQKMVKSVKTERQEFKQVVRRIVQFAIDQLFIFCVSA